MVGIDLGTTYSLVGRPTPVGVEIVPNAIAQRSTPSVVLLDASGPVVGDEAKRSASVFPDRTFSYFKRDMGTDATYVCDGRAWTPVELSGEVLRSLANDVEWACGARPTDAVITVPAYFGDAARHATVDAARHAGLGVAELIHEPTAAALAFGFDGRGGAGETVVVYDLGGGTFDVSVVRVEAGAIRVLATDGDHELGGKDFDDALIQLVASRFEDEHGVNPTYDPTSAADLRERCEDAKRALSRLPEATVSINVEGTPGRITVTRGEFVDATAPLIGQTETLLRSVLADAALGWDDVAATVLVGGSTRMPACAELVERCSGRPARRGIDPDLAVVHGASLLAGRYAGGAIAGGPPAGGGSTRTSSGGGTGTHGEEAGLRRLPEVKDVTAHALGFVVISADGERYVNEVMIPRNAPIPTTITKRKRLDQGVGDLDVYLLQGHAELPLATDALGRYRFSGVPGEDRARDVDVGFTYDADGIVRIAAAVNGRPLASPEHQREDVDLTWTAEDPREHARAGALHVVLVVDCSGSMMGGKLVEAQRSCADFARILGDLAGAEVGLVSFASGARVESPLTPDGEAIASAAARLDLYGSTDLAGGLRSGAGMLAAAGAGRGVLVVLTDGMPDDQAAARSEAARCTGQEIEIVTVGVTGADEAFLAGIATADASVLTDASGMRDAFRSIARSLTGGLVRRT